MIHLFANWKMYLDVNETSRLASELAGTSYDANKLNIVVFPTTLAFTEAEKALRGTSVAIGAQTVNWTPKGAYTGAVSAYLFKEAGSSYALIGHSERRHIFGETEDDVRKKFEACLDLGIVPVLCIGETKEDLDAGKREYRLKKQLMTAFSGLEAGDRKFFVAYEPVWAVGSGNPCDPNTAIEMHTWIAEELRQYTSEDVPILYGGSVHAGNVGSYISHHAIDGVLVGGASAKQETFFDLIRAMETP